MATDFVKGNPYFLNTKKMKQFKYLEKDLETDVLIVGGGISGALAGYKFAKNGIKTVLIDKGKIGFLNTSCATAILTFALDDFAEDLKKDLGEQNIVNAYYAGLHALNELDNLNKELNEDFEYLRCDALTYSLKKKDKKLFQKEVEFRHKHNIESELCETIKDFAFKSVILCKNGGAQLNPYLFTKILIEKAEEDGLKIFEHTEAKKINYYEDYLQVETQYSNIITCKKVIAATGYNTAIFSDERLCDKLITYSLASAPVKSYKLPANLVMQDSLDPYHYIKFSLDNRIIVGGEDVPFYNSQIDHKQATEKYKLLEEYSKKIFAFLNEELIFEFKFAGVFSATKDNMSVIGESAVHKNLWYLLGYGANGIINSVLGAEILCNKYLGKPHKYAYLFNPERDTK